MSLPGGVKRLDNEKDDESLRVPMKNNLSYQSKITRDYNSNIACLPGATLNTFNDKPIPIRNNQNSDIFNRNTNIAYNSFNTSNKRVDTNRIFAQSHIENKLLPINKAHRPEQIRNAFTSQIAFN